MREFDSLPPADQQAVGATLTALQAGFARRDADALVDAYTDDADWVNAFGTVKKGRTQIVDYLRGLFADESFDAGRPVGPPEVRLAVLTDDVVLAAIRMRIEGQKLISGDTLDRDNHSLHVLARQADGRWQIASEMYMDANRGQTYVAQS